MNIVLLGAPGSGKGTQAEKLAQSLKLFLFQTGNLARELAKKDERIKKIVNSGQLMPQEEMSMYAIDYLAKNHSKMRNILFEGFPRFISQYQALEKFLKSHGDDIDAVISLDISQAEAVRRISSRRMCLECSASYNLITNPPKGEKCDKCGGKLVLRKDDNSKSVKVRFEYYQKNTKKLIDYLDNKDLLIRVDGERPIEVIYQDIINKLKLKKVI